MGILGRQPNAAKNTLLMNLRVTTAELGAAIPIIYGQNRVSSKLLEYTDFKSHAQKQQAQGGKGIGAQSQTTYTYTAAIAALVAQGPIAGIVNVWDSKGRFSVASAGENYTVPSGGGTYTPINSGGYALDLGVGANATFSVSTNDYGGTPGTISGSYQVPFQLVTGAPGAGQYSVNPSTGAYTFHAADAGKTVTINYVYNLQYLETTESYVVPASPSQITVEQANTFNRDVNVLRYPSGTAFSKVGGGPGAGQYSVSSSGIYTFNAVDAFTTVEITYFYQDPGYNQLPTTNLNLTLFVGTLGQAPWGYLSSKYGAQAIGYSQLAYVGCPELNLGSNAEVPNYNYEVLSTITWGAGIPDANPADIIDDFLTNGSYGLGFPTPHLGDWFGEGNGSAYNFWAANSFFISPACDQQQTAAQYIQTWCDAGQVAVVLSEGLLKLKPYGDTSAAGNGHVYQPNTSPVVDLMDDDFIVNGASDDPVYVSRSDPRDAYNQVKVEYKPRLNAYNADVVVEEDASYVALYGLRPEGAQSYDFITTLAAAQFTANLRLRRNIYVRSTYQFTLGWKYSYLEPMDLVTITDSRLGYAKIPVRITKVDDTVDGELRIEAEEFPWGTATPTLYPKQWPPAGYSPTAGQADPGSTNAIVFEVPNRAALQQGNVLWLMCSGESDNWGGCNIWLSVDGGSDYQHVATAKQSAITGRLQTALGTGAPPGSPAMFTALVNPIPTASQIGGIGGNTTLIWSAPALKIASSLSSSKVLDIPGGSTSVGTDVQIWDDNGGVHQQWQIVPVDATYVKIQNVGTGMVLDVTGGSTSTGTLIQQYTWNGANQQQWQVVSVGGGFVKFVSKLDGQVLDLIGASTTNGTQIQQYTDAGSNNQHWQLIPLSYYTTPQIWRHAPSTGPGGTLVASGLFGVAAVTGVAEGEIFYFEDASNGSIISQLDIHLNTVDPTGAATVTGSPSPVISLVGIYQGSVTLSWSAPSTTSTSLWVGAPHATGSKLIALNSTTTTGTATVTWARNGQVFYLYNESTSAIIQSYTVQLITQFYGGAAPNVLMSSGPSTDLLDAVTQDQGSNLAALITASDVVELINVANVSLVAPGLYRIGQTVRGVFGTTSVSHAVGDDFVLIDSSKVVYQYDPQYVGKQLWLKFTSFNSFGNREQSLSGVTAYPYTIPGVNVGPIALDSGMIQNGLGSVPSSYTGTITYTATATSITFNWSIPVYRSDSNVTVNTYSGTQTITGLSASTTYYFYPYIDDSVSPSGFAMVQDGGIGAPYAWAHTATSPRYAQEQSMAFHVPISAGPISAATTASGTGGGSGGGTGSGTVGGPVSQPPSGGYDPPAYTPPEQDLPSTL